MNDITLIFSKLGFLLSPLNLLKIFRQFEKIMKKPKLDYPKSKKGEDLFLKMDEDIFKFDKNKFTKFTALPREANLVIISKTAYLNCLKLVGTSTDTEINQFLKIFGKEKDLKKLSRMLEEISGSFSTNLSMKELRVILRKQII
jgi:hypothetical protein